MKTCSFSGVNGKCHDVTYTYQKIGLRVPTEEEKKLLAIRSNIPQTSIVNICYHHSKVILENFSTHKFKCCNPFNLHNDTRRTKRLKVVSSDFYKKLKDVAPLAVPGEKICLQCNLEGHKRMKGQSSSSPHETTTETIAQPDSSRGQELPLEHCSSSLGQELSQESSSSSAAQATDGDDSSIPEVSIIDVNTVLASLDETPLKKSKYM